MLNLLKDTLIVYANTNAAAGQTTISSTIYDAKNYDAVCAIALIGSVTNGTVLTLNVQTNTANSSSGMATVGTSATYTDSAGESANTILVTDVIFSSSAASKRYVRCQIVRGTQNATLNGLLMIFYRSKQRPVTLDTSVIASALSSAAG